MNLGKTQQEIMFYLNHYKHTKGFLYMHCKSSTSSINNSLARLITRDLIGCEEYGDGHIYYYVVRGKYNE